jgi:hypothetical protein
VWAETVRDRRHNAQTAEAVNDALRQVIARIWRRYEQGSLRAEFELRADGPTTVEAGRHVFQQARAVGDGTRISLGENLPATFVSGPIAITLPPLVGPVGCWAFLGGSARGWRAITERLVPAPPSGSRVDDPEHRSTGCDGGGVALGVAGDAGVLAVAAGAGLAGSGVAECARVA